MGILSSIGKIVSKILPSSVSKAVSTVSKKITGSIFTAAKEVGVKATTSSSGGFLSSIGSFFSSLGKSIGPSIGKIFKGAGKFIKKIPIIGGALTLACELPNIYQAFKEEGFASGMKEIGKAALRTSLSIGAGLIAAAITGASFGTLGAVGYAVWAGADWALDKWCIKSYSSMKDELLEKGFTEEQIQAAQDNGVKLAELYDGVNDGSIQMAANETTNPAGDTSYQAQASNGSDYSDQYETPSTDYSYGNYDYTNSQTTYNRVRNLLIALHGNNYQPTEEEIQNAIRVLSQSQNNITNTGNPYTNMNGYYQSTNPLNQDITAYGCNVNPFSSYSNPMYQQRLNYNI